MSFPEIVKIKQLESDIQEYAQKYYNDGSSPVSDEEFDAMVDELRKLHPTSSVLTKVGWGYNINSDTTSGEKCLHRYGLIKGLDKCHDSKELGCEFFKDEEVHASLKLDGISVVLYYDGGVLLQALTRGDGEYGIDITKKVIKIDPSLCILNNDKDFTGAVRGEILMSFNKFDEFQKYHSDAKNARNSTAGLINAKEVLDDLKYLDIVVYTVVGDNSYTKYDQEYVHHTTMDHIVTWLHSNFNRVAPYTTIILNENSLTEEMKKLRDSWYGDYPADGIVLTKAVGFNLRTGEVQYDAKAFKFPAESKTTEVLDVEWNLSKTRYLIPKVKLAIVQLSGTDVSYATAYNAKYILDNNISKGCIVEVTKSGEIIPKITKVILSGEADIPRYCPQCGSELKWAGVHLQCVNELCGNAAIQDLLIWLQNIAPVDGLGDSIKLKFLEQMFGKDLSVESVMNQKSKFGFMMFAKGGHKQLMSQMFNRLYGFDNSKIDLVDALLALNIPRLGEVTSRKLAEHPDIIKTLMNYPDLAFSNWFDMLSSIVGEATTNSLYENQNKLMRLRLIEDRIIWSNNSTVEEKGKVAITGKLSVKRSDFEKELRQAGYTPSEISKDTKFLITDNPNSSSSKNIKADEWGIMKITEQEFRSKYMRR